jgi:hypothetical protein
MKIQPFGSPPQESECREIAGGSAQQSESADCGPSKTMSNPEDSPHGQESRDGKLRGFQCTDPKAKNNGTDEGV